jgi:gas vesicle protein
VAQEPAELRNDHPREQTPEEIRRDIERTREGLGETLEDIEDRVSPARIKERKTAQMRQRWQSVRESVMGSAEDVRDQTGGQMQRIGDRAGQATDTVRHAPDQAIERTQGNPLAAGLIAFGGGLLLASLFPATRQEQQAARQLRERYEEPVKDELRHAGQEAQDDLKDSAKQAADQVKQTAQEGIQHTREDAQSAAERTQQEAQGAAQRTQADAQDTAGRVRDQAQRGGRDTRDRLR